MVIGIRANPLGTEGWSQLLLRSRRTIFSMASVAFGLMTRNLGSDGFYTERDNFALEVILLGSQKGKSQSFSLWCLLQNTVQNLTL